MRDQSRADCEVAIKESTWDGYDAPRPDPREVKKRGEEEWICLEHEPTCTPSICEARGRVERDEHRKKEQEARRKRQEEREKRAQGATGAAGGDDASDTQGVILITAE